MLATKCRIEGKKYQVDVVLNQQKCDFVLTSRTGEKQVVSLWHKQALQRIHRKSDAHYADLLEVPPKLLVSCLVPLREVAS